MARASSFPVLLGAMLVAGAFAGTRWREIPGGKLFTQGDTWWHIAVGEKILSEHAFPTVGGYSCTAAGADWVAHEWLGEVVMTLAARQSSLAGLTVLLVGLSCLLMLLLYVYSYLRSRNPKAAAIACALVLPVAAAQFTLRPQLIGWIFLLLTLLCLELFRSGQPKALWILPALFLLWVNTHGSFLLGLAFMLIYLVSGLFNFETGSLVAKRWTGPQRLQLLIVLLLSVLVLTITPYGTRLATYPLELTLSHPLIISSVTEWQPIDFSTPYAKVFLFLLLLLVCWLLVFRESGVRLEDAVLLLLAIYGTCMHRRLVVVFALVAAPLLAQMLVRWLPDYRPEKDHPLLNAALLLLIAVGVVGLFPSQEKLENVLGSVYPRGAAKYLGQHPVHACLFNEISWGGYLIWEGGRKQEVFIDGRLEIYEGSGVLRDYIHLTGVGSDVRMLLKKYGVEACLLRRSASLATYLSALPEWECVYHDELSSLYVKKGEFSSLREVNDCNISSGARR